LFTSSVGQYVVYSPSVPGAIWLRIRIFANVPRNITSWLPRLEPYELKSRGETPCSINHLPAGVSLPIAPAGEMWSVVTESPNFANTFKSFKCYTDST